MTRNSMKRFLVTYEVHWSPPYHENYEVQAEDEDEVKHKVQDIRETFQHDHTGHVQNIQVYELKRLTYLEG